MKLFLIKLILLNFYNFIFCNIYSITNNTNISLSNEIKNLYLNSNLTNFSNEILNISNKYIKYSEIQGDVNNMIQANSFFQNNEYGFYSKQIDSFLFEGENSTNLSYNLFYKMGNYSYVCNKLNISNINNKNIFNISSQNYKRKLNEKINDINKFTFELGECEYNIESLISGKNYLKIISFKNLIFGLNNDDHRLYFIKENFFSEIINDISEYILNFFINNNIILILKENLIIFYQIEYKNIINQKINFKNIGSHTIEKNKNILDFKYQDNFIYISFEKEKCIKKFILTENNEIKYIYNYSYSDIQNDLISFQILQNTIYAVEKDIGIVIFNKTDNSRYNKIILSNAIEIDKIINPFNNYLFLGIYLNDSTNDEFFIEFLIIDEFNPIINKILTYKDNKHFYIANYITFDSYFTYFLDKANNKIIIIRRGLIKKIDFISYILPVNDISNLIPYYLIPSVNNKNNSYLNLAIKQNKAYYNLKLEYSNKNYIFFNFSKSGHYTIIINHLSDACSLINNDVINLCNINEIFNFQIFEKKNKKKIIVSAVICVAFFCLFISFVLFDILYRRYKNKDTGLNVKSIADKNDKNKLYILKDEYNNKRNYKNTSKQFKINNEISKNKNKINFKEKNKLELTFNKNDSNNINENDNLNNNNNNINNTNNAHKVFQNNYIKKDLLLLKSKQ